MDVDVARTGAVQLPSAQGVGGGGANCGGAPHGNCEGEAREAHATARLALRRLGRPQLA